MSLPPEFHEIAKRVNNWGRWGADDEIGTLNLITDEVVRAAAATVRTGRRVPLALPLHQDGIQTGLIPGRVNPAAHDGPDQPGAVRPRHRRDQRRRRDAWGSRRPPTGTLSPTPRTRAGSTTAVPPTPSPPHGRAEFSGIDKVPPHRLPWRTARRRPREGPGPAARRPRRDARGPGRGRGVRRGHRRGGRHRARTDGTDSGRARRRQARLRIPVTGSVGAYARVVPRPRCRRRRQRHPDLRDLPAGDRGPVARRCTRSTWSRWACCRARTGIWRICPQPVRKSGVTRSCCPRCPSRSSAVRGPPWPRSPSCDRDCARGRAVLGHSPATAGRTTPVPG